MTEDIRINREFPILNEDGESFYSGLEGTLAVDVVNDNGTYKAYVDDNFLGDFTSQYEAAEAVIYYLQSYAEESKSVIEEIQDYLD